MLGKLKAFIMTFLSLFVRDKRGQAIGATAIAGIIVTIAVVAVGSVVGLTITAKTKGVFDDMALSSAANTAMSNTIKTIYSSWPLLGIVVLGLIAAAAISAIMILR